MAERRVTKDQMDGALIILNGTILASNGTLQLYCGSNYGYYYIASKSTNRIYFAGTLRQCKDFVDGVRDVILTFGEK